MSFVNTTSIYARTSGRSTDGSLASSSLHNQQPAFMAALSGLSTQQQQSQGYSNSNFSSPYGPVSAPASASIPKQQQHIQAGYGAIGQVTSQTTRIPDKDQRPISLTFSFLTPEWSGKTDKTHFNTIYTKGSR